MQRFVLLVLVSAAACGAVKFTKEDLQAIADVKEDAIAPTDELVVQTKDKDRPAIHLPSIPSFQIIPQISFPGLNFPTIPLPSFPQFNFPELPKPFKKKEIVHKTKTVVIEHTKRVTRHPVCVTAYIPKPPCVGDHDLKDLVVDRELEDIVSPVDIQIQPTAVVQGLPETRIISGLDDSEAFADDEDADSSESSDEEIPAHRRLRFLVPHPVKAVSDSSSVATEPLKLDSKYYVEEKPTDHFESVNPPHAPGVNGLQHQHDGEEHQIVHGLLKETHIVTKTIVVTNVQKVIDHKVTATLIAKNCLPSEFVIPHCQNKHGLFKDEAEEEANFEEAGARTEDLIDDTPTVVSDLK